MVPWLSRETPALSTRRNRYLLKFKITHIPGERKVGKGRLAPVIKIKCSPLN
jgi:hypothetical protein